MELELGLSLPNHTPIMMKGLFDLNCSSDNEMELKKNKSFLDDDDHDDEHGNVEVESNNSLSLFLWSGRQPNDEEDDSPQENWRKLHLNDGEIDEENHEIVGWPPINSWRRELLHHHPGGGWMVGNHRRGECLRTSMYVKVKMEGVAIGRKIDLRLYNSYHTLSNALIEMFAKYNVIGRKKVDYTILYQDKEGDWMLAGDVPWEAFIESVQRMEILRNEK
ncbi:hypothetical protein RD792_001767 [Penstemon davidsonii]|uniref:Auxin-responsive protein n=1 Tax=Penstemon davidsonii TaxID=160366 RepID=A0ABR0DPA0_9LAMI|nr:hypothetical protein RD792_001767 [Penstemon davidsonii]